MRVFAKFQLPSLSRSSLKVYGWRFQRLYREVPEIIWWIKWLLCLTSTQVKLNWSYGWVLTTCTCAFCREKTCARMSTPLVCTCVHGSLTKNLLIILYYLINRSLKFYKDLSFGYGDICKTILTLKKKWIFNVFCIFPHFCSSKVWVCDIFYKRFETLLSLISKWKPIKRIFHIIRSLICLYIMRNKTIKNISFQESPCRNISDMT